VYATIGEIYTERSGILNRGVEGMMLIGAVSAFAAWKAASSLARAAPRSIFWPFGRMSAFTFSMIFSRTVREEVAFGPRNLGLNPEQVNEAVQHALELVGMESEADAYPFLLGRGERQKLAVASMIAMGPPMLIIDEPTTGQDLRGSLSIMNLLLKWHEKGRTIVIITHDMNIVAEYATRTVVMANGQVLADGLTREVLTDQQTLSRAFLKSPQITRVAQSLDGHFGFPRNILTVQEFYGELTALLAKDRDL
jgi:energy-coupling factor transport system ATP-binding protein